MDCANCHKPITHPAIIIEPYVDLEDRARATQGDLDTAPIPICSRDCYDEYAGERFKPLDLADANDGIEGLKTEFIQEIDDDSNVAARRYRTKMIRMVNRHTTSDEQLLTP